MTTGQAILFDLDGTLLELQQPYSEILAGTDHTLGVLTNGMPEWQRHKLREHALVEHVETVVTSYEAGAHKPAEAPYRLAEERLSARHYAMVGDSESDIEGAENAGWTAYRYTGGGLPDSIDWE